MSSRRGCGLGQLVSLAELERVSVVCLMTDESLICDVPGEASLRRSAALISSWIERISPHRCEYYYRVWDGWAGRATLHDTDARRTHSGVHESNARRTSRRSAKLKRTLTKQ